MAAQEQFSTVRAFVINALKQYHQVLTDATDNALTTTLSDYVAKESGKGLSTEDFTTAYMSKLTGIESNAQVNVIETVKVDGNALTVTDKGVNIDLSGKVDTVSGKGLSTEDFTTSYMAKLTGIESNAQVNVKSDWNTTDTTSDSYILNKPSLNGYFDYAYYDSTNHEILFKNGGSNGTTLFTINANDFIKDGMVSNVEVKEVTSGTNSGKTCLVVTFNTDANKQDIEIPITEIFNPSNYYTTTQVDNNFVAKESGKGLSTEDFTTAYMSKLDGIASNAQVNVIETVKVDGNALTVTDKGVNIDLSGKVDTVSGKGLSTEDFTTTYMSKLTGIESNAQVNVIETVKVDGNALTITDKGVNIDLSGKVDTVSGKGLSTEDFTTAYMSKLDGIASNAQVNVIEGINWNGNSSNVSLTNKVAYLSETQLSASTTTSGNVVSSIAVDGHALSISYTTVLTSAAVEDMQKISYAKTDLTVSNNISDTYYPTTNAVASYIGSLAELNATELSSIFDEQ